MCGIVGYISKSSRDYVEEKTHFMRFALAVDTLRGSDSTGIMTLNHKFDVDVMKTTMPGDRFVHSDRYKKGWRPGWAQVGHNRAATRGKVSLENAHPFSDGPITLVHNGTLWAGGKTMPKVNEELEVDSMQIAHNLAEHKCDDAKTVLEAIDGSFAVVWFDWRDKSINMARNAERPLHYCVSRSRDIVWFMSDGAHLSMINRSFGNRPASGLTVFKLESGVHLKFFKGQMVPKVEKFDPYKPNTSPYVAKTRGTHDNGKKPQTALEKATQRWEKETGSDGVKTEAAGCLTRPKVRLGDSLRSVPRPMLDALKQEYDLSETDLLRFIPNTSHQMSNNAEHWLSLGEIIHPGWGDCNWNAVVIGANKIQAGAYMNVDWLVRPIGISHPWDLKAITCPSILCQLVHCDWKSYEKSQSRLREIEEAAARGKAQARLEGKKQTPLSRNEDGSGNGFVTGPGGFLIPLNRALMMCESGCISCGINLTVGDVEECQIVNEGRDLLCPGCVSDLKQSIPH